MELQELIAKVVNRLGGHAEVVKTFDDFIESTSGLNSFNKNQKAKAEFAPVERPEELAEVARRCPALGDDVDDWETLTTVLEGYAVSGASVSVKTFSRHGVKLLRMPYRDGDFPSPWSTPEQDERILNAAAYGMIDQGHRGLVEDGQVWREIYETMIE